MEWRERLKSWFKEEHYLLADDTVSGHNSLEVIEKQQDGEGKIVFLSANTLLKINSGCQNHLAFLIERKDTDGVFLEFESSELKAAHFIELKKTVNTQKWKDIKNQVRSSLKHSLGFLGVLGLSLPKQLVCHVCFQNDDMKQQNLANFALKKPLLGERLKDNPAKIELEEWNATTLKITRSFPMFELQKHQLQYVATESTPFAEVNL